MNDHVAEPFRTALNQFAHLDAQNPEHRAAQVQPDEGCRDNCCPRCYCDPCRCVEGAHEPEHVARDSAGEPTPADVDGSGGEQPYDGGGWPGDGSGTDDLADLMAHGDEGCCDGPDD